MKKNKYITFILLVIIILISILYFQDYFKIAECNCNTYILGGRMPEIELDKNFDLTKKIDIKLNQTTIHFKREHNIIQLYSKIKKTDTLKIKINNYDYKIYDFKNYGSIVKHGKNRGEFNCFLDSYKIDTIYLKGCESDNIYLYKSRTRFVDYNKKPR